MQLRLTHLLLQKIAELGECTLDSFFPARYPQARLWRKILGLDTSYSFKRSSCVALLVRLQHQGLVHSRGWGRQRVWRVTPEGQQRAENIRHIRPLAWDGVARLVIFDIPEKHRAKRNAIRSELISAGFIQLQRSVWYGERPLHEDFLELIDILGVRSCVHIFSINRRGTLPQKVI